MAAAAARYKPSAQGGLPCWLAPDNSNGRLDKKIKKKKPTKGNSSSQGIPRYPRQTKSNPRPKGQKRITTKKEEKDEGPTGIIHPAVCRDRPPRANKASPLTHTHTHTLRFRVCDIFLLRPVFTNIKIACGTTRGFDTRGSTRRRQTNSRLDKIYRKMRREKKGQIPRLLRRLDRRHRDRAPLLTCR